MTRSTAEIWSFNRRITYRLMIWATASVLAGLVLAWGRAPFRRALGIQFMTWGAIDAAIALGGQQAAERKQATASLADDVAQANQLRRVLVINTALDVLYVAGGLALHRSRSDDAARKGHALGIVVQGAFLFIFDLVHALRVPRSDRI